MFVWSAVRLAHVMLQFCLRCWSLRDMSNVTRYVWLS